MGNSIVIEVAVLVCEQGHRWSDAAKRFANLNLRHDSSATQAFESQLLFQVLPVDANIVESALECYRYAAVVWEVNPKNLDRRLSNLAQLHRHAKDRLQWLALDDPSQKLSRALPYFMSFGVSGILTEPMHMQNLFKLITSQVARSVSKNASM